MKFNFLARNVELNLEEYNKNSQNLVILGTSPSLNEFDINILKNSDCDIFICNGIFRMEKFKFLIKKPGVTYFFGANLKTIAEIAVNENKKIDEYILNYFSGLELFSGKKIFSHSLVNYFYKKSFFINNNYSFSFQKYENIIKKTLLSNEKIDVDLELCLNMRHTPQLMILIGIILGYKNIELYGLQHSYVKDRFEGIESVLHSYSEENSISQNMAHRDLTELFLDSHLTFKVYKELNKLAKILNVNIYDYTIDGCLDMFEKRKV
jgi:hypothetical protein